MSFSLDSNTLVWKALQKAGIVGKLRNEFTVPAFSYSGVDWLGASRVFAQVNYSFTHNFTLPSLPIAQSGFIPCIKWRSGTTVYRYKLWENIYETDDTLYAPLYAGQKIGKNFTIELWSTIVDDTPVGTAFTLLTNIKTVPAAYTTTTNVSLGSGTLTQDIYGAPFSGTLPDISSLAGELWLADTGLNVSGANVTNWHGAIAGTIITPTGVVTKTTNQYKTFPAVVAYTGFLSPLGLALFGGTHVYAVALIQQPASPDTTGPIIDTQGVAGNPDFKFYGGPSGLAGATTTTPLFDASMLGLATDDISMFTYTVDNITQILRGGNVVGSANAHWSGSSAVHSYVGPFNGYILALGFTDSSGFNTMRSYLLNKFKHRAPLPLVYSANAIGGNN